MKICSNNHGEVAYDDKRGCPCCQATQMYNEDSELATLVFGRKIERLEKELKALELFMPKRYHRAYDGAGVRPAGTGAYELMVDCRVVEGLHNKTLSDEFMMTGMRFNCMLCVGAWMAVTPVLYADSDRQLFQWADHTMPRADIDAHNAKILAARREFLVDQD